jgi:hypothetical protein
MLGTRTRSIENPHGLVCLCSEIERVLARLEHKAAEVSRTKRIEHFL